MMCTACFAYSICGESQIKKNILALLMRKFDIVILNIVIGGNITLTMAAIQNKELLL